MQCITHKCTMQQTSSESTHAIVNRNMLMQLPPVLPYARHIKLVSLDVAVAIQESLGCMQIVDHLANDFGYTRAKAHGGVM